MEVMLSGDFINVGSKFCNEFSIPKGKKVTILFCAYAFETATEYINAQKMALRRAFNVDKIIDMTENYEFKDDIDVIFVNGGYGFSNCVQKWVDSGHDKKIRELVESGTVYIGESTGAVLACNFEHPEIFASTDPNLVGLGEKYRKFTGFHFADGVVITHMSRYRFPKNFQDDKEPSFRILNRTSKGVNPMSTGFRRIHALKNKNVPYISMKENSVFVIKDGIMQCKTVDWSHLPVRENIVTDAEKRIKDIIAHK